MKRLGVIARADSGGLGNLLWELCRHLEPARVLIMDLGVHGRSDCHFDRFEGLDYRVSTGWAPKPDERRWLLDGCDVLYGAETWYADEMPHEARARNVRTVLHVMPELYLPSRVADELWVPTTWRRAHLPGTRLVPVPVALDRFEYRRRSPAKHFVHVWAPAMLDRNGTDPTLAALEAVTQPIDVTLLGGRSVQLEGRAPVTMKSFREPGEYPDDYFDLWPDDADVLVLPRRFAGLSMPVQEAAARGMPAIMTGCEPQSGWPGVMQVRSRGSSNATMAGGQIPVHDPDPASVAEAIDRLAADPGLAGLYSDRAYAWAQGLSWDVWADRYRELFDLV
ncbi:MAG TPA: hypothetical protein VMX12_02525 [Acidimicrobiia bacterium]|nr:hypothetical protein [Acidimicrobiia bacterium]